jgi:raffinose/stachyose/melibiose transport system substrate-binding protein
MNVFLSPHRRPLPRIVLGVLAATATIAALAGCGSAGNADDGTTEITLSMQNPDVESADPATWAIVEAFEEANPDITVTVSGEAVSEHLQKLSIAAQSDTLPDIFWVYKSTAEEMQEAGKLLDLAPVLDGLGLNDAFPESTVANFSAGDVIYGVPYQGLLTGLWYNSKILSDNGLEVPVTFDDLLHVAETLSAKGITTISNGANQSSFSVWSFLVDLDRFGYEEKIDGILDGSEQYDNPDFLRLYEHIAELRDAGAFASNVSTQTYQQAVDQFTGGNAAMLDAGVWASSAIQESPIAPDTGFWIGPQFDDGVGEQNIVMNVASAPFAVSAKVAGDEKKLDAVTKFLDFYYGDEAQQILVDNGQPPVTTYEPVVDAQAQSALKAALDASTADGVTSPQSQPDLLVSTPVANAMYDSIYGVIQNQLTPKQALELVQKALDAEQ